MRASPAPRGDDDLDPAQSGSAGEPGSETLAGLRILLCEDDEVTAMQLHRILDTHGMEVIGIGRNGQIGLALALLERPDMILMDIHMPLMDGLEASGHILDEYPCCIVIVSADANEANVKHARDLGVSGWVTKPIDSLTLLAGLTEAWTSFQQRMKDKG